MTHKRYTKDDVERHSAGYYAPYYPAVNVKAYHLPSTWKCAEHFNQSEEWAEKALESAFNSACTSFWEDVQNIAVETFGRGVKVYSAGRSGGWVIVKGLTDIADWDAVDLAKWRHFENTLKQSVRFFTSDEIMYEDIEAHMSLEEG